MRRSIEAASTAVHSVGLSPYRRIQSSGSQSQKQDQSDLDDLKNDGPPNQGRNWRRAINPGRRDPADISDVRLRPARSRLSGHARPNVALVEKPFSEAELMGTATQVLNGHFRGFTTIQSDPA
jgi:hypothetical protein